VAEPVRGGPGWQRLRQRGPGSRLIEAEPEILHGSGAGFAKGDRCFHQKFGMGRIRMVEGDHLTIDFDNAGSKKVVAAFVEKA
jgi:DNA helicase-2/ATP-dependent DNA helicase PcrA